MSDLIYTPATGDWELVPRVPHREVVCHDCQRRYEPHSSDDFFPDEDNQNIGRCEHCMKNMVRARKNIDPHDIPYGYPDKVCKAGMGSDACRFLLVVGSFYRCAKGSREHGIVQYRIRKGKTNTKGNNCSGPPSFSKK